jgi:D-alanyl-D-alanine dipeptidase
MKARWFGVAVMFSAALVLAQGKAAHQETGVIVDGGKTVLFGGGAEKALGPMPAAVRAEWAGLVGEYGWELGRFYVLEDGGQLKILSGWFDFEVMRAVPGNSGNANVFQLPASGEHGAAKITFVRDAKGAVTGAEMAGVVYPRRSFPAVGEVFQITPLRPVVELRREALASKPPIEAGNFRRPDLVELNKLDPTIKLDVGYATSRNFLGAPMYTEARAYMQRPAAEAVARVSRRLRGMGYGLVIHDAYRPWYVTKMFWDGTPAEKKSFVADPAKGSRHNRGCAVDLSLYELKTGNEVRMTGGYDEMSERSYPYYPGGTARERWHRDLLRQAMEAEGFAVIEDEWWHFDYKEWKEYPILNVRFEELEKN